MNRAPLLRTRGRIRSIERVLQRVEADVPAGAVAGGFAELVDRVDQSQGAAGFTRRDLEADGVASPSELEQRWWRAGQHLAVERLHLGVGVLEAQLGSDFPFPDNDLVREPLTQLIGFRQGLLVIEDTAQALGNR